MSFQIVNNFVNTLADTPQNVYTASAAIRIDSFTASNTGTVNASYKAYISDNTTTDEPIIPFKVVVWGENDLGIGLVNQVIPAGYTLKIECSQVNAVYITITGKDV